MRIVILVILGWLVNFVCIANTLELTIRPNTSFFYFSLPSNPTTGYVWSVKSYDSNLIRFKYSKYKATNSKLIGGGGIQQFYFNVLTPTDKVDTYIDLSYSRPWEKSVLNKQKVHICNKK